MKTLITSKRNFLPIQVFMLMWLLVITLPALGQTKYIIEASNTKFTPSEIQISVGDTVEWRNVEGYHNVDGLQDTFPSNPESFGNSPGNGWTYTHVFTIPGSYDFRCDPHYLLGMVGKIEVVQENTLTVHFMNMTPHVGQDFWLAVTDKNSGMEIGRVHTTATADFDIEVPGIETGMSYNVDFYADFNANGMYDAPPADHAWRMELNDVMGDTTLTFTHNTDFTDIMWKNKLTVHFMNMTPHVGQDFWLAVTDKNSGMEIGRVHTTATADFDIEVPGIETGMSYNVDFYADFNANGMYDAPPADHAWRMELNDVMGDTTLTFTHNTDFTDIMWKNKLTVHFMNMTPHLGQMLKLYVVDKTDGMAKDTVTVDEITNADFDVISYSIVSGNSYNIDFFADFNENGSYDAPPTDHAWRIDLNDVTGDTTLTFTHNTNFTDIFNTTSASVNLLNDFTLYPNPAKSKLTIETGRLNPTNITVSIYDITGRLKLVDNESTGNKIILNIQNLTPGIYFVGLKTNTQNRMIKWIKN